MGKLTAYTVGKQSEPLSAGTGGAACSASLKASAGTVPYWWSVTSGSLPPGVTVDDTLNFTVVAEDANHPSSTRTPTSAGESYCLSSEAKDAEKPTAGVGAGGDGAITSGTGPAERHRSSRPRRRSLRA